MIEKSESGSVIPGWVPKFLRSNAQKATDLVNKRNKRVSEAADAIKEKEIFSSDKLIKKLSDMHKINKKIESKFSSLEKKVNNKFYYFFPKKREDFFKAYHNLSPLQIKESELLPTLVENIKQHLPDILEEIKENNKTEKFMEKVMVVRNVLKNPEDLKMFDKGLSAFIATQPDAGNYILPENFKTE